MNVAERKLQYRENTTTGNLVAGSRLVRTSSEIEQENRNANTDAWKPPCPARRKNGGAVEYENAPAEIIFLSEIQRQGN